MEKHYLTVYYDGSIFEYSKTKKEGFVEKTNTKGTVSYRKFYNSGVVGVLKSVAIRTNEHLGNREELVVTLESPTDKYIIQTPIMSNQGGELDDFAASWTSVLPNMEIGKEYKVVAWRMNKGDKIEGEEVKYTKMGISVKHNDQRVPSALTYEYVKNRGTDTEEHIKGDVPMLKFISIAGKNSVDAVSKQNRLIFLYESLKKSVEWLAGDGTTTQQAETTVAPKKGTVAPNTNFDVDKGDDSDLPF